MAFAPQDERVKANLSAKKKKPPVGKKGKVGGAKGMMTKLGIC